VVQRSSPLADAAPLDSPRSGRQPAFTCRAAGQRRCPGPSVVGSTLLAVIPSPTKGGVCPPHHFSSLCDTSFSNKLLPPSTTDHQPYCPTVFIHQSHFRDQLLPSLASRGRRPSPRSVQGRQAALYSIVVTSSGLGAGFRCQIPASALCPYCHAVVATTSIHPSPARRLTSSFWHSQPLLKTKTLPNHHHARPHPRRYPD
jgi:hypothetical protein